MEEVEEVYFRLHAQIIRWTQRLLSVKNRERIEMLLFVVASHLLLLCFLLHTSFISAGSQVSCLEQFLAPSVASYNLPDEQKRLLRIQILPDAEASAWNISTSTLCSYSTANRSSSATELRYTEDRGLSFVYAPKKSLLALLEHADALQTDVKMDTLFLPIKSKCFEMRWFNALPLWTTIRDRVIGYDTILVNQLLKHYGARGVFYREDNRVVVDMSYGVFNPMSAARSWLRLVAMKFKILHTILFLFFVITALVAFVLMETQKRMITFAALFQNRLQLQISFANLVVTFFAQSLMFVPVLVGMLFFLFELYKDRFLAFGVMTIMWVGESFSVISVRTRLSQAYFPPLFLCLFTFLHVYFFSFPFGFSYVALSAMSVLLLQLMLFFWNCFEIPALNRGEISRVRPREPLFLSFSF
ncbi:putative mitochondrial protein [Phytophthora megakarya]|uniref:Putative mitochondrial protein n=1 Tax=Phytophthora megakarya TaxID=4795 RepID=A0A225VUJ1_9STRA|nr:putative mitochondrial protein [Phytophthora megakarya]